jgi:hypothetical protein
MRFRFAGGTGFDPVKDMHMHEARYVLGDDGRLTTEWTAYDKGQPAGSHSLTLRRE